MGIVATGFGVAAFGCFAWGLWELIGSLFTLIVHGQYPFEPFWQTLGLEASPHKVMGWDRAWWLVLIIPSILYALADEGLDFARELDDDGRQLAKKRMLRRRSDPDFARSEQRRRERKRKKRERGPMNGWQRLGVVLSILFGVPM